MTSIPFSLLNLHPVYRSSSSTLLPLASIRHDQKFLYKDHIHPCVGLYYWIYSMRVTWRKRTRPYGKWLSLRYPNHIKTLILRPYRLLVPLAPSSRVLFSRSKASCDRRIHDIRPVGEDRVNALRNDPEKTGCLTINVREQCSYPNLYDIKRKEG